jgi:hypothetical protein
VAEGFTKLFKGITRSSLWSLDNDHKAVWVFLMAEADENGCVVCTVPGIAKANDVTVEKAEAIIKRFMSPDPYSGTKELEGRRIEEIDRGWRLVNHAKFRRMRSREEKLEYDRLYRENERLAAKLAKLEGEKVKKTEDVVDSRKPSPGVVKVDQAEEEAEAEEEADGSPDSSEALSRSEPPAPPAFVFPVVGGGSETTWNVTAEYHAKLVAAFPAVDVAAQYQLADVWLSANPLRRKTGRGMPKFLYGWMERAQNAGLRAGGGGRADPSPDPNRGWAPPKLKGAPRPRLAGGEL